MAKVAKLVQVSFMTRVIVDENDSQDEIIKKARPKFMDKVENDLGDNIEYIGHDDDCPYEEGED